MDQLDVHVSCRSLSAEVPIWEMLPEAFIVSDQFLLPLLESQASTASAPPRPLSLAAGRLLHNPTSECHDIQLQQYFTEPFPFICITTEPLLAFQLLIWAIKLKQPIPKFFFSLKLSRNNILGPFWAHMSHKQDRKLSNILPQDLWLLSSTAR